MFLFFIKIHKKSSKSVGSPFWGSALPNFSKNGQSLICFWFLKKCIKSRQEESGEHFEVRTPPKIFGKGQIWNVSNFLKNTWKSPKKRRETILSVRETISKVDFFEYCQILKCSFLSKTHTLSNKSVARAFLVSGRPF